MTFLSFPAYDLGAYKAYEQIGLYSLSRNMGKEVWNPGGWSYVEIISKKEATLRQKNKFEGLFFVGHYDRNSRTIKSKENSNSFKK